MADKRIDFYIGLGDKETGKMEDKEAFKKRLADFFTSKKIPFHFSDLIGGYVYNDSSYIIEDSLKLTIIGDYSKERIKAFVDVIKSNYSQESILVNEKEIKMNYE